MTHHRYPDGILVEVIVDDGGGDVTSLSVEFDRVAGENGVLAPREDLPRDHEDAIREHLEEADYSLQVPSTAAGR